MNSVNGHSADWHSAWSEHERWLRAVVYARLRDREATDEVMQNVAVAAASQSDPGGVRNLGPWLYRVAVRQCILFRRQCGRRRKLLENYARHQESRDHRSPDPDPLSWLLSGERRDMVRQALMTLPGRDMEILLLKYGENWSYQQIAQRLAVSQSAVEARLHRARARLRSAIGNKCGFEVVT